MTLRWQLRRDRRRLWGIGGLGRGVAKEPDSIRFLYLPCLPALLNPLLPGNQNSTRWTCKNSVQERDWRKESVLWRVSPQLMSQKWFEEEGRDLYKGRVWIKVTTANEPIKPFPWGWTKLYIEVPWKVEDLPQQNEKEGKRERDRDSSHSEDKPAFPLFPFSSPHFPKHASPFLS